jgi:hypothetical protein
MANEPMFVRYIPSPAVETFGSNSQTSPKPTEVPIRAGALEIRQATEISTCGYVDGVRCKSCSSGPLCPELTGMVQPYHCCHVFLGKCAASVRPSGPPAAAT